MGASEKSNKKLALCDCEHSMTLDAAALAEALGLDDVPLINSQLCRAQLENFRALAGDGEAFVTACTQEAPFFEEVLAERANASDVSFTNIRERAGWSEQGGDATPKIAALLAEAALDIPAVPTVSMASEGVCLVYGRDETALEAARQLNGWLEVTVLLTRPGEVMPPQIMDVPVFKGTIAAAKGHLGAFELIVNDYAPLVVSSRHALGFEAARDGAQFDMRSHSRSDRRRAVVSRAGEARWLFQPGPRQPGRVAAGAVRPSPTSSESSKNRAT